MNNILNQKLFMALVPVVAVSALVLAGYFYAQVETLKKNPQVAGELEMNDLLATVSKHLILPTDETPDVATVSDLEALKSQPFFAKAQEGDKVLIYKGAKKVILYSVSLNKIIDIAPLNTDRQETTASLQTASTSVIEIAPE